MNLIIRFNSRLRRSILFLGFLMLIPFFLLLYDTHTVKAEDQAQKCMSSHNDLSQSLSQPRAMGSIALSSDGRRFVVAVDDRGWSDLLVFDAATGRLLLKQALPDPASSVALAPNGDIVAVSFTMRPSGCPHIALLNETELGTYSARQLKDNLTRLTNSSVKVVNFSSDGNLLAASLDDGIYVWDIKSGRTVAEIEPPGFETRQGIDSPQELVFSPDGKYIAGVSERNPVVYLWSLISRRLVHTFKLKKFSGIFGAVVFNKDGTLIAVGTSGPLVVWNTNSGAVVNKIMRPADGPIGPVAFMGAEKLVVSGVVDLKVWNVSRKKPVPVRDLRPSGVDVDTVLPLSSDKLVGITSNGAWEKTPDKPLEIKLIEIPSGKLISIIQVPGRDSHRKTKRS